MRITLNSRRTTDKSKVQEIRIIITSFVSLSISYILLFKLASCGKFFVGPVLDALKAYYGQIILFNHDDP